TVPATAVTFMASNTLQVTAPAGNGTVDVVVNVGGITSPVSPADLYTYAVPVVTSVVPNAGPPAGGTVVLINGLNFTTNSTVTLGGTQVAASYISPMHLQATSPAAAAGTLLIQVTTPNGTSAINTIEDANPGDDLFTYSMVPIIASLNPL